MKKTLQTLFIILALGIGQMAMVTHAIEEFKITTSGYSEHSVFISGDYAIVGKSKENSAYIFIRDGDIWIQQAKLTTNVASVSISGDYAIVGASGAYSAYIFVRSGETWIQQAKLTASDAKRGNSFGTSVSISGNHVVIGAPNDDDAGYASGSAYIFARNGETWAQQAKLIANDATERDQFGHSVSISGDTAIVGTRGNSAYIFVRDGETWIQQAKLTASDAEARDYFGTSVSISGENAIVGAPGDPSRGFSGSAYIFARSGGTWSEQQKLTASDAARRDRFGCSVSINRENAIVGAEYDDDDSGSAYIFVRSGEIWIQQAKLTASDAGKYNYFGCSVSISGNTAIVGTRLNSDSAYIYDFTTAPSPQINVINSISFGKIHVAGATTFTVSISNTGSAPLNVVEITSTLSRILTISETSFIVAPGATHDITLTLTPFTPGSTSGILMINSNAPDLPLVKIPITGDAEFHVCEQTAIGTNFSEVKLTASDAGWNDNFGNSVFISGEYAIVGNPNDDDAGEFSGSAYIFVRNGKTWVQQAKLIANDADTKDGFGESVSISGDYAIVGASGDDDVRESSGSAYIFIHSGGIWIQKEKLTASDATRRDYFGSSVSISGDTAIVGAKGDDSAYIFVRSGETWVQQAKLIASDVERKDYFGSSVSISQDYAIVGAYGDDDAGESSGSAYIFVRSGETWIQQAKLMESDATEGDRFGHSVAINGDTAIVGAYGDDDAGESSGSAYIFVRNGEGWVQQAKFIASDAEESDWFGGSVSINGDTAIVGATGNYLGGSTYIYNFTTTLSPQITVSREPISIGKINVGETTTFTVSISNTGSALLNVTDITSTLGKILTIPETVFTLDPGATHDITLTLTLPTARKIAGTLTIISNDPGFPSLEIPITGDVYTPITVKPNPIRFSRIAGESVTMTVNISNTGSIPVNVKDITSTFGSPLTVSETAFTIEPGATRDIELTLTPAISMAGEISGMLVISSDAPDSPIVEVAITGKVQLHICEQTAVGSQFSEVKLTGSKTSSSDEFGNSVSISGDYAIVGNVAYGNRLPGRTAYIFVRDGTSWIQQAKLSVDGIVSISGDTAIVGVPGDLSQTSSAYIFVRREEIWIQQAILTGPPYFGRSVSISGDTAIVGSLGGTDIFVRNDDTWIQQAEFSTDRSVSISGNTAIAGHHSGSAYIFVSNGETWIQQAKLTGPYHFGDSVSISGDTAIIGATGSAYIFVRRGETWTEQQKLTGVDSEVGFGSSVSISGDTAIVGVEGGDDYSGSAYIFVRNGDTWTQHTKLTASDAEAGDKFGSSVSISGETAIIGAPEADNTSKTSRYSTNSGAAYIYSFTTTPSPQIAVSPDLIDLGNMIFGESATVTVNISNTGSAILNVVDITSNLGDILEIAETSFTLEPGATQEITLTLTPATPGEISGMLTITSNDPDYPTIEITIPTLRVGGATIRIPQDQSTIQAGIDYAVDGDMVLVADGTYTGESNVNLNFSGKAITVKSVNGPETTIIDCENTANGFDFVSDEEANSVLDGLTITNGRIGIDCESSPTIMNCVIMSNTDGGINVYSYSVFAAPRIINCFIVGNRGGGINLYLSDASIINCTIVDNTSNEKGGGIRLAGKTSPIIRNSIIWGNVPDSLHDDTMTSQPTQLNSESALSSVTRYNITYSDIQGWDEGESNINLNPMFVDARNGNYHLQASSPCLDSANCEDAPAADIDGLTRPLGDGCEMGCYEYLGSSPIPTPTNLEATVVSSGRIDLFWQDNSDNEDGFEVFRKADPGNFKLIAILGTNETRYSDISLRPNISYTYRIRTTSAVDGFSGWSNQVTQTTPESRLLSESKILFESNQDGDFEIYTMNSDGSELTQLTSNSDKDSRARWSPDGSRIVFIRNDEKIWIMDSDGSNQQSIRDGEYADFSPDGQKLVFSDWGGSAWFSGNALFTYDFQDGKVSKLVNSGGDDSNPDWSPDGQRIVFASKYLSQIIDPILNAFLGRLGSTTVINLINAEGEPNRVKLTEDVVIRIPPLLQEKHANFPRWSPDGSKIVYQDDDISTPFPLIPVGRVIYKHRIYIMDADGNNKIQLPPVNLNPGSEGLSPVWSPDGRYILFATQSNDATDIFIMNSDGSDVRPLTNSPGVNEYPLDWVSTAPPPSSPVSPTELVTVAKSDSQIDLSWKDNSNDEEGFQIERKTDDDNFIPIAVVEANFSNSGDTGLQPGTTYTYRVRAYSVEGVSSWSNETSATTLSPAWDVNEDGVVDILDLVTVGRAFGVSVEVAPQADVNQDGSINILDIALINKHFGKTNVPTSPALSQ